MQKSRHSRAYPWLHRLLRWTVGRYFKWHFQLSASGLEELKRIPRPWLVLPNHVMTWDPVFIQIFLDHPVHFIAADANFRNRVASFWLRRLGAIPTSKKATDFTTLRQMLTTLKSGSSVGLFPEGERTWDGVSMDIIPATAKLARLAKVPVVIPVIQGAYLSLPRWSKRQRRGPVHIQFRLAIGAEELQTLSLDEIQRRIQSGLYHSEDRFQHEQMRPYINKRGAEGIGRALFVCPNCHSLGSIEGHGRTVRCKRCSWSNELGAFGFFRPQNGHARYFREISAWSEWQKAMLAKTIHDSMQYTADSIDTAERWFFDPNVNHLTGFKNSSMRKRGCGVLSCGPEGISFNAEQGKSGKAERSTSAELTFPWHEIDAMNVVYQSQLEFYFRGQLQVFTFADVNASGYKYAAVERIISAGGLRINSGDNGTEQKGYTSEEPGQALETSRH